MTTTLPSPQPDLPSEVLNILPTILEYCTYVKQHPDTRGWLWNGLIPFANIIWPPRLLLIMEALRGLTNTLLSRGKSTEERKRQEQQAGKLFRLRGHGVRNDITETLRISFDWSSRVNITIRSYAENPYHPYNNPPFRFGHPPWAKADFIAILEFSPLPKIFWDDKGKGEWDLATQSGRKRPSQQGRWILDTHFMGFTPVHPKGDELNPKMDLIAISGLNGHAFGSFKKRGGSFMWLLDALPRDLTGVRVLIYGYDTQLTGSKSFQNINDLGIKFRTDLKVIRGEEKRPLVILGHSLGGIVAKQAIIQMPEGDPKDQANFKSICGLLFFGVPNRGMATESLIPMVEDQPNKPLVEALSIASEDALQKGNETLQAQSERFSAVFNFRDSEIISFYETLQSPTALQVDGTWRMTGKPAALVDRDSATYSRESELGDRYIYPVNQTHSNMVKFNGFDDDTYGVVVHHLKRFKENAGKIVGRKFMDVA